MGDIAASGSAIEMSWSSGTVPGGPCCRRRPVVLVPKYACLTGLACTISKHYSRPHATPNPRAEGLLDLHGYTQIATVYSRVIPDYHAHSMLKHRNRCYLKLTARLGLATRGGHGGISLQLMGRPGQPGQGSRLGQRLELGSSHAACSQIA